MTATTRVGWGFQVRMRAADRDGRQTTGDDFQTRGDRTKKGTVRLTLVHGSATTTAHKGKAATVVREGNLRVSSSFSLFSFLFFLLSMGAYAYLNTNRIPIKFLFPFSLFYFKKQLLSLLK